MGHRETELMRDVKATPEGEALGRKVLRHSLYFSAGCLVVVALGILMFA
jgi:hypothetical protein